MRLRHGLHQRQTEAHAIVAAGPGILHLLERAQDALDVGGGWATPPREIARELARWALPETTQSRVPSARLGATRQLVAMSTASPPSRPPRPIAPVGLCRILVECEMALSPVDATIAVITETGQ